MEVKKISPPVSGFLQLKLEQEFIDYLWKIIDIAKKKNKNYKGYLVGNISQSLLLDDIDSFFYKSVCIPLVKIYRENDPQKKDPVIRNTLLGPNTQLVLDTLWVNYQYQTEFNPYHDHDSVYSFAIWMKIPYSWEEQKNSPKFSGMREINRKVGNFEFEYMDTLGGIRQYAYQLSSKDEGTMLFFPARLRHCVYPFFETEEPRISIAGNLSYLPV